MITHYTIQMASKISGVGVHTIRAWEKRYKAIVPIRDEAGHRVYSKEDVEKLILLSELCLLGYTISKIASMSSSELKAQLKELGKKEESLESLDLKLINESSSSINVDETLTILRLALKTYKLDVISQELLKLKIILSTRDLVFKIISPLMGELGRAVESREYSISQEHALSALVRFHLGHLLYRQSEGFKNRPLFLVCGVEGDMHEFGILQASLLCQFHEYNVVYLGPNLPVEALIDTVRSLNPDGIIVGATAMMGMHTKSFLENYLEKLSSKLEPKVELIFGSMVEISSSKILGSKKFHQFSTLEAFDHFLKNKES